MSESKETHRNSDEVFLEIEGKTLRCSRKTLMDESDYFKAMFAGDFIERNKTIIKLNDVAFRAFDAILTLFWDERYVIPSNQLLSVLETACMLQFLRVKHLCVDKILNEMTTENCFEIWRVCEFLDIRPLFVKAKAKALREFSKIAHEDSIYQLDLSWFCKYVANRNLECESEMEVFQCCMRWFYENCDSSAAENNENTIFVLLGCLDFNALSVQDLREMKAYPDLLAHAQVANTIDCVIGLKKNAVLFYDDAVLSRARIYLEGKKRIVQHCICFVVTSPVEKRLGAQAHDKFVVHICDPKTDKTTPLLDVDNQKISQHMRGYRIIAHREHLYVIGGQYELGLREFVKNVWVYDLFREKWERSTLLPFLRRDFDVCISGENLFIVGGSGEYASVQNNLFWYNFMTNTWSEKIDLPVRGDDVKICPYRSQLFLLSVSCARAYVFNPTNRTYTKIDLCDEIQLLLNENFVLFVYNEEIYLKGRELFKTQLQTLILIVVERYLIDDGAASAQKTFAVLSDDWLYMFHVDELRMCTLEKLNVATLHTRRILERQDVQMPLFVGNERYYLREIPNLFLLQHYGLVEEDEFVTDYFLNVADTLFNR